MMNRLRGDDGSCRGRNRYVRVRVPIESREVARRDLQSDAVTPGEYRARRPEGNLDRRGLGCCRIGSGRVLPTQDAVGYVERAAVRVDVDQLGREIGVRGRR